MAEDQKKLAAFLGHYGRLVEALKEQGQLNNRQAREILGEGLSPLLVRQLFHQLIMAGKVVAVGSTKDRRYRWQPHLPEKVHRVAAGRKAPPKVRGAKRRGNAGKQQRLPF
jgi:hypothetical protein